MDGQHTDVIIDGFYKIKRGGRWLPVAIWTKDGTRTVRVADTTVADPFEQHETFLRCKQADKAHVRHAFENAMQWPLDAIGYEPDTSADAVPAPPPPVIEPAPMAVKGETTARAEVLGLITAIDKWSSTVSGEIDKDLADTAANNDDRLIQLAKAVKAERDASIQALTATQNQKATAKADADKALKVARAALDTATEATKAAKADWSGILARIEPAREACKQVYVSWQRARDVAGFGGKDAQCGGQFGSAKGYLKKNDALHPENIAAARAAAEAAQRVELERQLEAKRQSEIKTVADAAAEKARLAERDRLAVQLAADRAEAAAKQKASAPPIGHNEPPTLPLDVPEAPIIGAGITDWTAAVLHYADHPTIRDAIRTLATKDLQAGRDDVAAFAKPVRAFGDTQ